MSCGVDLRHSSDPATLCLWCMLAAAALIQPLAWEPPYAAGAALNSKKKKKKKAGIGLNSGSSNFVTTIFKVIL